jgi:hypothetical protein
MIENIANFLGGSLGFVMRLYDFLSGKRKNWHEERKP